jgi:autotransporter strand-loop-strand O-heptosyltransferase
MITYNLYHVQGIFFELLDDEGKNREYDVSFVDRKNSTIIYETKLKPKSWAKSSRSFFSDVAIFVKYEGRTIKQINLIDEIKGKRVFINFESKSIGDTLAWIPYCKIFKETYNCEVIVSTFHNYLFEKSYPELKFEGRGVVVNNIFGMFDLGWFYDKYKEPLNPSTIPLQKTATNILNLPFMEVLPILTFEVKQRPLIEKYIAISSISTSKCKHWDYWQELIDNLVDLGYKVFEVSKERTSLKNIENLEDKSFENIMNVLHHSDLFIGLSSGISWLNWSLGKRSVMISNFSNKDHEFQSNCIRIINEDVCHGCWNNPMFRFNKGDWNWCPINEDTPQAFECHKSISASHVFEVIKKELNNNII